ncbi:MAG: trigger factor [Lachnospiraceae bacterium]|nr:trigger factor [Lachnospiraceae bacterium]
MKKKILASVICVLLLGLLCACASDNSPDPTEQEVPVVDIDEQMQAIDPDQYVTLGDYYDLPAEVAYYTYSEDDVRVCVENELSFYVQYYDLYEYETNVSANTVESGSIVNIDYVGKVDDVAFAGGTAAGQHLLIGSGKYIPGFEEGLIDAKVGDTVDLHVTFPEGYDNTELAGKDAVFTVSVNSIEIQVMPVFTDELIASLNLGEEIATYDDYVQYIRDYLEKSCNDENQYMLEDTVWEAAYSVCQVSEPPEFLVDFYQNDLEEYFESYAAYYGMDLETFVAQMGMTMDDYAVRNKESAVDEAKIELAYMAIAKAEGIEVDDAKMQEVANEEYAEYGYQSAEDFVENMGAFNFRSYVRRKLVTERLEEVINIIELDPIPYLNYEDGQE